MTASSEQPTPHWINPSVRALARDRDPIAVVVEAARTVVAEALDDGWEGPPFDPIVLADRLGIPVVPIDDVFDARLVPVGDGSVAIEYNPNRPAGRRRFSLAHEVAHLLFPDYGETVRNRAQIDRALGDDWQLEALCNLAASEFVMPIGSFAELAEDGLDLRELLDLRRKFDVSTEAILQRAVRLNSEPGMVFACSRTEPDGRTGRYRVDYTVGNGSWKPRVRLGSVLRGSVIAECTAIGYTARSEAERWPGVSEDLRVEAVGIPPYPGHLMPRVVGLLRPAEGVSVPDTRPVYLAGDATMPRGSGPHAIVHVVNDRARTWRGGFAAALRARLPESAEDFTAWVDEDPTRLVLGAIRICRLDTDLWTAALVAQAGYGPSKSPRIRYAALRACLTELGAWALDISASVHMPRIGTGQAGGDWSVIGDLVRSELCARGIPVTVYDPPGRPLPEVQGILGLSGRGRP